MRRYKIYIIVCCVLLAAVELRAQVSEGGIPLSLRLENKNKFTDSFIRDSIPDNHITGISNVAERARAKHIKDSICSDCRNFVYGRRVKLDVDIKQAGKKITLPAGNLWVYKVSSDGAHALQFYFKKYKLPPGANLFIYNTEKRMTLGAFTHKNNHETGILAMQPLAGDTAILEYFEPKGAAFPGDVKLREVAHSFEPILAGFSSDAAQLRDGDSPGFPGASQSCEINVACSTAYANEQAAIAQISYQYPGGNGDYMALCSGALINYIGGTPGEPGASLPYFYTANHCIAPSAAEGKSYNASDAGADGEPTISGVPLTDSDWQKYVVLNWVFLFNYQSGQCTYNTTPALTSITGADANILLADETVDFALIQLGQAIPAVYNVTYLGWDISDQLDMGAVGIHHPSGDLKKISTTNHDLVKAGVIYDNMGPGGAGFYPVEDAPADHYMVLWDYGITEHESSGSPLISAQTHKLIGHLHAGTSQCSSAVGTAPDYYGSFAYAFNMQNATNIFGTAYNTLDNANINGRVADVPITLATYLDPNNTGYTYCNSYIPSASAVVNSSTCYNGKEDANAGELGTDCGGPCAPCSTTKGCTNTTFNCGGPCGPCPTCTDGVQDGYETGIDCGGPTCVPCSTLCNDGKWDGDEVQTDCGGSCGYGTCSILTNGQTGAALVDYGTFPFSTSPQPSCSYDQDLYTETNCCNNPLFLYYPFSIQSIPGTGNVNNQGCLAGQWYASHGEPWLEIYRWSSAPNPDPAPEIDITDCYIALYGTGGIGSDDGDGDGAPVCSTTIGNQTLSSCATGAGIYYQLPNNLDPYKQYILYFDVKNNANNPGNGVSLEVAVTNGLRPYNFNQNNSGYDYYQIPDPSDTYAPLAYSFSKYDIMPLSLANFSYDAYTTATQYFTVPNDQYNQLWFRSLGRDVTNNEFYNQTPNLEPFGEVDIKNIALVEMPGLGPTCTPLIDYNNNATLPTFTQAVAITAETASVAPSTQVHFEGSGYVTMSPGFSADAMTANNTSNVFDADIGLCGIYTSIRKSSAPIAGANAPILQKGKINTKGTSFTVSVQPNPSTGLFTIDPNQKLTSLEVMDVTGRKVYEVTDSNVLSADNFQIDLSGEKAGIYVLIARSNSNVSTQKIVVAQ